MEITLNTPVDEPLVSAVRALPSVRDASALDGLLRVSLADPVVDTPDVVRALVSAGAGIVEVRNRAATLEEIYFEVMGVRPGVGGEAA